MSKRGVVFYSLGTKCLVRLAVAVTTLRRVWNGNAIILHYGLEGADSAREIAKMGGVDFQRCQVRVSPGKNTALLGKTLLHKDTPYDCTVMVDADTVTLRPFNDLFWAAEEHEFATTAFSDWKSYGGKYSRRIKDWRKIVSKQWIEDALAFGPALNTGVFAFRKDSQLQAALYDYAVQAREFFIPDEIGVCILAPHYPHKVLSHDFNCSCRYDDPRADNVRIVHFHGNKHARFKDNLPKSNSDLWYTQFEKVRDWPVVQRHITHDRQLRNHLPTWDKLKGN